MANTSSVSRTSDLEWGFTVRELLVAGGGCQEESMMEEQPDCSLKSLASHSSSHHDTEQYYGQGEEGDGEEDEEGEDDDETDIGMRALAFDPTQLSNSKGLPVNGHDFLKMVQEERNKLPGVVTVRFPPPSCSKKSTQGGSTVAMEVLQSDEQLLPPPEVSSLCHQDENLPATQQSSIHPMDISQRCDTFIDSSDEESENCSIYSSMASKEFREKIRLKSLGCTPLNISSNNRGQAPMKRPAPSTPIVSHSSDLLHRDRILANFLKLRMQIELVRKTGQVSQEDCESDELPSNQRDTDNNKGDKVEEEHDKGQHQKRAGGGRMEKNLSRSERRASGLLKIMNLGHAPQVTTLVHKSQMVLHMTLDKLAEQCEKAPIYSTLHADWIYSLIALLREPIEPDICSTLRRLAKVCMLRRDSYERRPSASPSALPSHGESSSSRDLVAAINKEEYYACLLIICIVRFHFGQADLNMPDTREIYIVR